MVAASMENSTGFGNPLNLRFGIYDLRVEGRLPVEKALRQRLDRTLFIGPRVDDPQDGSNSQAWRSSCGSQNRGPALRQDSPTLTDQLCQSALLAQFTALWLERVSVKFSFVYA
jgi:hypothetical protein